MVPESTLLAAIREPELDHPEGYAGGFCYDLSSSSSIPLILVEASERMRAGREGTAASSAAPEDAYQQLC